MSDLHASAPGQVVVDLIDLRRLRAPLLASLDAAEAALIDYGRDKQRREPLLHCLWAAHHITTALGALQLYKAEMLALEMQRGFLRLLRADVVAERRNLEMGGFMRAIKTLPRLLGSRRTGAVGHRPRPGALRERPAPLGGRAAAPCSSVFSPAICA